MAKKKASEKKSFVPVLVAGDIDKSHFISPKAAFKMVQVVEFANLSYMFGGFDRVLRDNGLTFQDLVAGEFILFINTARNYLKMVIGNGTPNPVIAAYRFPKGMRLPSSATQDVVRSFLKKGDIQADERLSVAIGETLKDMRRRVVGDKTVLVRPKK